jgi:hypothetical protein
MRVLKSSGLKEVMILLKLSMWISRNIVNNFY